MAMMQFIILLLKFIYFVITFVIVFIPLYIGLQFIKFKND
jgi:putative Mn2+ efflux pump MntP